MSDVVVKKDKLQEALVNGRAAYEIVLLLDNEKEEVKKRLEDYEKTFNLDFHLGDEDVSDLLKSFNSETKDVAGLIDEFPQLRFLSLMHRLDRKVKHNDSDSVPVTNTELFLVDALTDEKFSVLVNKYKVYENFVLTEDFHVKDLFSEADIKKAENQHSLNILGIAVGVIASIIVIWSQLGSG